MGKELDCLNSSINTFFDSVETQNKNKVTKDELLQFLQKYSKGESIEKGLDLLFLFNHLFRGDKLDVISRKNFVSVLSTLKGFNQEAINIFPYINEIMGERKALRFRDDKPTEKKISWDLFRLRRAKVKLSAEKMRDIFAQYLIISRPNTDSIDITDLLTKLERQDSIIPNLKEILKDYPESTIYAMMETILSEKDDAKSLKKLISNFAVSITTAKILIPMVKDHIPDGNEDITNHIRALLFMKRVFLGGKSTEITHLELNRLIKIFPSIVRVGFDLTNLPYVDFGSLKNRFVILAEDLDFLKEEIAFSSSSQEKMVTFDEIFKATDSLRIKFAEQNISAIKNTVRNVKGMLIGGSFEFITAQEVHNLMDKLKYAIKMVGFGYEMYEAHDKEFLELPDPLNAEQIQILNQYPANNEDVVFKNRFIRVVSTYHLFKGKEELPSFSDAIKRTAEGVAEIMLFEYAVGFILNYYNPGSETLENYNKLSIKNRDGVVDIIRKIKDFLELRELYPRRIEKTADNIRLVTDLFQTTSDGKNGLGLAEGVDLIGILRDASKIGKGVLKTIVDSKLCEPDAKGGVTVKCYRENFYQSFSQYSKYFPKFKNFVKDAQDSGKNEVLTELLTRTEFFSRDCALESRPIYSRDMSAIVAGLMDIESTIIHLDQNHNNVIDYNELQDAFPIYKNAIIVVAKLTKGQEFLAKSIFFYLIKYQKIPTTGNLFVFFAGLETGWDKNITGDRVTIATLLKYISSMNAVEDPECR
ncbi:MAG: hypothetical protein ACOYL6_12440 [Bacteriovoracaceae bacterium]